MSPDEVHLTIDGCPVTVPPGTLIVDAAKRAGVDIPVFCYHPKLDPVGMCRMCLVEVGRPARDRTTGEIPLDENGKPKLFYNVKLETACTTPVGEGWDVRVRSEKALAGRKEVVEFLLTSHPLDCPICDKGGECPLQNLTLGHGPGTSRFAFDDKIRLDKRVPLGDLIVLDRERCIQCARCVRFQEEIVDDPVIGFYERGRKIEIVTFSEPGFDSYFSGNTTDICPVGALTTNDFRFGARPWELNAAASICPHCAVGCNLTLNTRREAWSGGGEVVKRVMPRQNEEVNETWICDKGRFAHHFASSPTRLRRPLIRREGALVETSWEEALQAAADGLRAAGDVVGIAGGRLSNEDLFVFRRSVEAAGGRSLLDSSFDAGDVLVQFGLGRTADLAKLGQGDAILVVGSDLHEEAPLWWLRVKQAAGRGASLIVAHPRPTRLDKYARHRLTFEYGRSVEAIEGLAHEAADLKEFGDYAQGGEMAAAGKTVAESRELVVFFGREGLNAAGTRGLAEACAALLAATGHAGRANSGLVAVWPRANDQGAADLGFRPAGALAEALGQAKAAYLAACDPLGDDPAAQAALDGLSFLVVQELYRTATAEKAHVVLPAQSFIEREGSLTNGEGRVQRYYPAVPPAADTRPDWWIAAEVGARLGGPAVPASAAECLEQIAASVPAYRGLNYAALAQVREQWPLVGGEDLYFGGTAYANRQGLGVKRPSGLDLGATRATSWPEPAARPAGEGLLLVPVERLYDRGTTLMPSQLLEPRRTRLAVEVNPADAQAIGVGDGGPVLLAWDGRHESAEVVLSSAVPAGVVLVPRSSGLSLRQPARGRVHAAKAETAP